MAVQVQGVPHVGGVDESEPYSFTGAHRMAPARVVGLVVEAPVEPLHGAGEPDAHFTVGLLLVQRHGLVRCEVLRGQNPSVQFVRADVSPGNGSPPVGAQHGEGLAPLSLGERDEGEDAVLGGDQDVVPLGHAEEEGVGLGVLHGIAVGVRDGHGVVAERNPEGGLGARVDDAQPDAVARPAPEHRGTHRQAAVGQVVRVRHTAPGALEQAAARVVQHPGGTGGEAASPGTHGHASGRHGGARAVPELGEHAFRGGAVHAVDPVVEDDDPLRVVGEGFPGIVDDERGVQRAIGLESDMRVEEIGARVGDGEAVGEVCPRADGVLRHVGDAVHVAAQPHPVRVEGGGGRQTVGEGDTQDVTGRDAHQRSGQPLVVGPAPDGPSAQVQRGLAGGEPEAAHRAGTASPLGGKDFRTRRVHVGPGARRREAGLAESGPLGAVIRAESEVGTEWQESHAGSSERGTEQSTPRRCVHGCNKTRFAPV